MPGHEIIVIGTSAGGVQALKQLVAGLPPDIPAAIFMVIHLSPHNITFMPEILNGDIQKQHKGKSSLRVIHPQNGEVIQHGRIYIAPPDYHMLVKPGYIRLVQGPHENGTRPAIDPLFRTAAKAYGRRVVGVILTGMLDDGTAGLTDVKRLGGVAIVQDPEDAQYEGMPSSAIENVDVDYVLPLSSITPIIVSLAHKPVVEGGKPMTSDRGELDIEPDIVELDGKAIRSRGSLGTPSRLTCPDCGGTLSQLHERKLLQFRCHVGHAWSISSLQAEHTKKVENALWLAIRSLEERADLMSQVAKNAYSKNRTFSGKRFEALAQEAEQHSDLIRQTLFQGQLPALNSPDATNPEENQTLGANFKVVVLTAADGGLNALSQILLSLPSNFDAAIIVVPHLDTRPDYDLLTQTLNRSTIFPLIQAQTGEPLQPGMVYIAPPDSHLFVTPNGSFCLSQAVFTGLVRPSADLLLQSVAASFKQQAIAVVLSGKGNDGVIGIQAIDQMGGTVIAQDESTAKFFELPHAAIATEKVDFVLPLDAIISTLINLVTTEVTA